MRRSRSLARRWTRVSTSYSPPTCIRQGESEVIVRSRAAAWAAAGEHAPDAGASAADPITVDLDATLITAHPEKESAKPTFKRGFGFHPLCAFADHGPAGSGEALVIKLRPGNAGSNTARDHIDVVKQALAQLPGVNPSRPGKKVLIRTDGGAGTHAFINWLSKRGVQYSIGFTLPTCRDELYRLIPETSGPRPTTRTATPGTGRTSRSSPGSWT